MKAKKLARIRAGLAGFLAVLGPGFITAMVDNDAGGIYTYSEAGARFGYVPLWSLIPITLILIVTQEMCARMGAVTGKGLSDLIREEFGLRATFLILAALLLTNLTNIMANFAGVASSLELFNISRYITVPLSAVAVWLLVVKGTYSRVEKVFLGASAVYICYCISAFLVKPNWKLALEHTVKPTWVGDPAYVTILIGLVGTSVAPWMQFYLQASIVEKGITAEDYVLSRLEVIIGCVAMSVIAFFIIVACAGAIWSVQPMAIRDAADAALALKPFGKYAYLLFAIGLFNASLFAATIQPLSTAYTVCEGLGFESGLDKSFREAPIFYGIITLTIFVSVVVILLPGFPLVRMILFSQVLNGVLLPFVLIFMLQLVNKHRIMGKWTNTPFYNLVSWATVITLIALTLVLTYMTLREL